MKLICKLKDLMALEGITQMALAQKTGLAAGTVGKLYRNQVTRIDENTVKTLCRYFQLKDLNQLLQVEWEDSDYQKQG